MKLNFLKFNLLTTSLLKINCSALGFSSLVLGPDDSLWSGLWVVGYLTASLAATNWMSIVTFGCPPLNCNNRNVPRHCQVSLEGCHPWLKAPGLAHWILHGFIFMGKCVSPPCLLLENKLPEVHVLTVSSAFTDTLGSSQCLCTSLVFFHFVVLFLTFTWCNFQFIERRGNSPMNSHLPSYCELMFSCFEFFFYFTQAYTHMYIHIYMYANIYNYFPKWIESKWHMAGLLYSWIF